MMALIAGFVMLCLLAISDSSAVPIEHSSSSVSVKNSGKDYSYTIQETHGVGVEPAHLVEHSSIQVVAKSGHPEHPAGDAVHHAKQPAEEALGHGAAQHQQQHHDQGQVGLRSVPSIQGHVIEPHVQDQFSAGLAVDPSQAQVRGIPVGDQAIVAVPAQAVRQDHAEGPISVGQIVPVFSIPGGVQNEHDVNAAIPQHEQSQVEMRSFQSAPVTSQFRAFQDDAHNQFGVNGFLPVHPQNQGHVKGFFDDKNPVPGIVSRVAGVPTHESNMKGFFVDKNQVQGIVNRFAGVPTQGHDVRRFFVDKNQVPSIVNRFGLIPNQDSNVRGIFVDNNQLQGIVGRFEGIPNQLDNNQVQDVVGRFGGGPSQENDVKRFFVDKNQVQDIVARYGVQNQDNSLKSGVEAFRLVPARDLPVVQVSNGSGVRYPYAVLYPIFRYA